MTGAPLTPDVVAERIEDLTRELAVTSEQLTGTLIDAARLQQLVDVLCAEVVEHSTASSVDRRKAEALRVCSITCEPGAADRRDILTRCREAQAQVLAIREAQHTRRAILDGFRSQGAAIRAELQTIGYSRAS